MTPETIPDATGSTPVAWQDGQPFSPRYGDRYHTQSGARAQAEHVFLGGCGLPEAWSGSPPETVGNAPERDTSGNLPDLGNDRNTDTPSVPSGPACWTILETGFGLGLNFLSAWACWQTSPIRPATLRFVSTEAHPVSAQDIRRAGADDPRLQPLAERLADAWPDATTLAAWYSGNADDAPPCHTDAESEASGAGRAAPGRTSRPLSSDLPDPSAPHASEAPSCLTLRFDDPQGTVELRLLLGDAATRLEGWHARHGSLDANSVFLDGFDPKKNPAMWDVRTMQAVARHCRPGTRIATWCVARSVRDALTQAGFRLHKRPGLPPKRHCLVGDWPVTP
ncbi:tRNA (5-methylaminomethyl-2-thiouridine)(34)-methyltransferase MnmD [Lautropia mirabilis]|uniref:tRNA (5-methylaminomethyl-2-thiouridine)(34)-methyltransferase MnmD n=1 Tax=Lautropia mirabilis TaxID=47671 RepID=UPI0035D0B14B